MSVTAHLDVLEKKHDILKREIESAYAHHVPDVELLRMKKLKLRLKDEIRSLREHSEQVAA